jgi:cellulose synthase/poly-beta-1,6-N-acetylglucosamine synthase-like glycosyltransferase
MVLAYAFSINMAFAIAGGVMAMFSLYLFVLAIAAFFYRGYSAQEVPGRSRRIVILVPAHNEADFIARCVRSLRAQTCIHEYEILVIADNCTDDTAAIARSAGAQVLIRDEPFARGKGRALRWAIDQLVVRSPAPDAVVVVDADSVAESEFLARLCRPFEEGADAVQGESLLSDDGPQAALRTAAVLLINRVCAAGRTVLGLPCSLSGNGMLFSRELLVATPWDAFTSAEDAEYTITLRKVGVRPVFAGGATLYSPGAPTGGAADQQQLRWEGGKFHLARTRVPRLIWDAFRMRRPSLLGLAFDLALPPLGFLAAGAAAWTAAGGLLAWHGSLAVWAVVPSAVALVSIPLYVLIGLRAGDAPASAYRALARAPQFVCAKIFKAYRLSTFRADNWVRTERPGDRAGETGGAGRPATPAQGE